MIREVCAPGRKSCPLNPDSAGWKDNVDTELPPKCPLEKAWHFQLGTLAVLITLRRLQAPAIEAVGIPTRARGQ